MALEFPIEGAELIRDIRFGIAEIELLQKYGLTRRGLEIVLQQISEHTGLSIADLYGRAGQTGNEDASLFIRRLKRINLLLPVEAYCREGPQSVGIVRDVTETGMKVRGLRVEPGQDFILVVQSQKFLQIAQFQFEATCRWAEHRETTEDCLAGFEIVDISPEDKERLQELIHLVT